MKTEHRSGFVERFPQRQPYEGSKKPLRTAAGRILSPPSFFLCGKRVVVFSIMTPTYSYDLDFADEILVGYSYSDYSIEALFGALNGEYQISGTIPFEN